MPAFAFSKIIPGGNPTLVLSDPDISPEQLSALAVRLMDPMHIQAEQVGALYSAFKAPQSLPGVQAQLPHLQMMGGEFCVNATLCAALLLTRQRRLSRVSSSTDAHDVWRGELTVSGIDWPICVLTAPDRISLEAALAEAESGVFPMGASSACSLTATQKDASQDQHSALHQVYCAARINCVASEVHCLSLQEGVTLALLPGIYHILIDTSVHPLPDMHSSAWQKAGAIWRIACGFADFPASGVVWFERLQTAYRIWPAVQVTATQSEFLESACGSASLAMALVHSHSSGARTDTQGKAALSAVDVCQPSGEFIRVFIAGTSTAPETAWVSGLVRLVAQGMAYV